MMPRWLRSGYTTKKVGFWLHRKSGFLQWRGAANWRQTLSFQMSRFDQRPASFDTSVAKCHLAGDTSDTGPPVGDTFHFVGLFVGAFGGKWPATEGDWTPFIGFTSTKTGTASTNVTYTQTSASPCKHHSRWCWATETPPPAENQVGRHLLKCR